MLSGFRQEDFLCFHYISHCKTCDPGMGPFLVTEPLFEISNKLGKKPLGVVSYLEFVVQDNKMF